VHIEGGSETGKLGSRRERERERWVNQICISQPKRDTLFWFNLFYLFSSL